MNEFIKQIKVLENKEEKRLLKLQEDYSKGDINDENINEEDTKKLNELYNKQIEDIKKDIEESKKKILEIINIGKRKGKEEE